MKNGSIDTCPVCGGMDFDRLYPPYRGRCITSQMFFADDIELDNRVCRTCGFIFNLKGIRGKEEKIYNPGTWKPKPQVLSFDKVVKTSHERAMEAFESLAPIPNKGSLLDFGAGTGAFLKIFNRDHPGWELSAIEPGGGFASLSAEVPLKEGFNAPYYALDLDATYDIVAVMSVLEHVVDPMGALAWIRRRLKLGGMLLMQHPNFAKLPGDLFCADHINKLTMPHTQAMAECAGFRLLAADTSMLPFYCAFEVGDEPDGRRPDCCAENILLARAAEKTAKMTVEAVRQAVEAAGAKGGRAAVFGSSPIGSMAPKVLESEDMIVCFVDENPNFQGLDIDGIEIVGPEEMAARGVTDIALGISPVYWEAVAVKLVKFGVTVHVPKA